MAVSTSSVNGGGRSMLSRFVLVGGLTIGVGLLGAGLLIGWTQDGSELSIGIAVASPVGLVAGLVLDRWLARRLALRQARQARSRVLTPARVAIKRWSRESVFALLAATRCPTPFWGRRDESDQVADWLDTPDGPAVMLVTGAAGVGKTRFAAQCGEYAQQRGWVAGWLTPGQGGRAVDLIDACAQRTLVLVDDADTRADAAELLEQLAAPDRRVPVWVMLIARDGGRLRQTLRVRLSDRARPLLRDAVPLALAALTGNAEERRRWFIEALQAYGLSSYHPRPERPDGAAEPILTLHVRALAVALSHERLAQTRFREDRWSDSLDGATWGIPPQGFGSKRMIADGPTAASPSTPVPPTPTPAPANPPGRSLREVAHELLYNESQWWMSQRRLWMSQRRFRFMTGSYQVVRQAEFERALLALALLGANDAQQAVTVLRRLRAIVKTCG